MQGKPVKFSSNPNNAAQQAAHGAPNQVAKETFNKDMAKNQKAMQARPRSSPKGSMAGLNTSKSAYIERHEGGYKARPRPEMNVSRTDQVFIPKDSMPSVRMSDYRKPSNIVKGLSRLR